MKNKWYRSHIIERFMSEKDQETFDRKYQQHKKLSLGQQVVNKPNMISKLFGKKGGE